MPLKIVDSGVNHPEVNMSRDEQLLEELGSEPIFHLYDWDGPSATFGYFSDPMRALDAKAIGEHGIQLARRPTGGGVIFHQYDLAFSFLLPASHRLFSLNTLANYQYINGIVAQGLAPFLPTTPMLQACQTQSLKSALSGFCMATLTIYDVSVGGRKVAGAAQRKTKYGLLHQGSICLTIPSDAFLEQIFLPHTPFADAIRTKSYPLITSQSRHSFLTVKKDLQNSLLKSFKHHFE